MAVVSISRIQVRRGQKNVGSGLPQLASGEFGWAVDSQELYIGNGSVAEGSPFVGNTKLLSEADNLFEFANTYQYKTGTNVQTGSTANNPVLRTLQSRLDDRVSVRSFGVAGDGTDQTVAIQRAIDQLYLNASNKGTTQARVELIFEAGEYNLTNSIYLPPYTTIRGAGKDKTIINGISYVFRTINDSSTPGVYANDSTSTTLNQARNISISGLTINATTGPALVLTSCKDSVFKDLLIKGAYSLGGTIDGESDGIRLDSLSSAVGSNNNMFDNVIVEKFVTAIKSDDDIKNNTWTNCTFNTLWQGHAFGLNSALSSEGPVKTGPIDNTVSNSKFNDIYTHAIHIKNGTDNISKNNRFYTVGNNGGNASLAAHSIIKFESIKNNSHGDWFQRSEELGYTEEYKNGSVYVPEVEGPSITTFNTTHKLTIGQSGEYSKLFRLPADTTKGYEIDYVYKSSAVVASRSGTMTLIVDPVNNTFNFSDDFNYTGNNTFAENLKFKAQNYDEDGNSSVDTIAIMMLNLTSSDNAVLHYNVKAKS